MGKAGKQGGIVDKLAPANGVFRQHGGVIAAPAASVAAYAIKTSPPRPKRGPTTTLKR